MRNPLALVSLASVLACSALIGGCIDLSSAPAPGYCQSTTQCTFGQVCDVPNQTCVPEPVNGLSGKFSCVLAPDFLTALTPQYAGTGPELIGTVGDLRLALHRNTLCYNSPHYVVIDFRGNPPLQEYFVRIYLQFKDADQTSASLGPAYANSNYVFVTKEDPDIGRRRLATSVSGTITLDTPAVVDQPLSGYFAADVQSFVNRAVVFGEPCPQGDLQCGYATQAYCYDITVGTRVDRLCTKTCASDKDCEVGEGVCVNKHCTHKCGSSGGQSCVSPLKCEKDSASEMYGCL